MLTPSADENVPFQGPRPRYNLVGEKPTTLVQKMATATNFDGALPATAGTVAANLDPTVTGGLVVWDVLTHGGLFPFTGRAITILDLFSEFCTATWAIVDASGNEVRPMPASTPFSLAPNEWLKITSTNAVTGVKAGIVAKLDMA